MKIVGIAGKAGSGKDTVADYLVTMHGFTKVSFASTLKEMLRVCGFPEPADRDDKEKNIEGFDFSWRQAAQLLGTEWGRSLDPDLWVKIVERNLRRVSDRVVISDVRFENEAAMIRRQRHGMMLFLEGRQANLGAAAEHISEKRLVPCWSKDILIDNHGDLYSTKLQVCAALGLSA